jgi:hypothetical protein
MPPRTRTFIALPFTLTGVFVLSVAVVSFIPSPFGNWSEPFVGPVCAAILIFASFGLAPARPRTVGAITLCIGALVAWWLLHKTYFPELHPRAYQPTLIPFYATLGAGLLTYAVCGAFWRRLPKTVALAPRS